MPSNWTVTDYGLMLNTLKLQFNKLCGSKMHQKMCKSKILCLYWMRAAVLQKYTAVPLASTSKECIIVALMCIKIEKKSYFSPLKACLCFVFMLLYVCSRLVCTVKVQQVLLCSVCSINCAGVPSFKICRPTSPCFLCPTPLCSNNGAFSFSDEHKQYARL